MLPEHLNPAEPMFTFKDAVALTQAAESTLENWIEWKHLAPAKVGRRRMFSFEQLLKIDVMFVLAKNFRVEPNTGAHIAAVTVEEYLPKLDEDVADIRAGSSWHSPLTRDGWTYGLTRDDKTGELRATTREDDQGSSVMIVVPVRVFSRRMLATMAGEQATITWGSAPAPEASA